jgi:PAS domain S-box-containing protein
LQEPGDLIVERCDNGLVDCAVPIIIKGKHIASLATGQILLEEADIDRFRLQAELFGCDVDEYLEALKQVPVVSEEKIRSVTGFLGEMAHFISRLGYSNLITKEESLHLEKEIAERKRAEEELFNSRQMLQLVLDTIPQRVFWKDRNSVYLGCNRLLAQDCGYTSPRELIGKTDYETASAATADIYRADDRQVMETGLSKISYEEAQIKPDGSKTWLMTSKVPLYSKDGLVIGVLGTYEDITERKLAEEKLRASEALYRTLVENIPQKVFMKDTDSRYISINEHFARDLGVQSADVLGKVDYDFFPKELADKYRADDKRIMETGGTEELEERYVSQGKEVWVKTVKTPVRDENGEIIGIFGIFWDITELKQAEEDRKLNESRLETLLQLNHMTGTTLHEIVEFAMEEAVRLTQSAIGYVAFMNADETLLTMHAWSRQAMQECLIVEKPLDYPVETTGLWGEAVRQRRPIITNDYQAPNPLKRGTPPGHVIVNRHMNVPILDNDRVVIVAGVGNKPSDYDEADVRQLTLLMSGMWRIVQRKQAEEALRHSEEKYRLVVENANDAIFIAQDGRIKFSNSRLALMSGYSLEELTLKPFLEFVHPEDRDFVATTHTRRLEGEEVPNKYSFRAVNNSGETLWVEVNSVVIMWEGKAASLNFLRDITDQKKLESQLLHSQKMESIGTLAGGIAHDFNNILAAIVGYSEIIKVRFDDPGLHSYLEPILFSCDRAKSLVGQILTFSRTAEREKMQIDMASLVKEGLKLMRATLPSTIAFRQKIPSGVYTILADPTQIHQVLINLCTNAAHAMREKGGELEVNLDRVEITGQKMPSDVDLRPGHYVKLTVSDTGSGIPPGLMHRIFDPFFTTKMVGEGTGLGLSVVYGIVKGYGGAVIAQSEVGSGSIFSVYLPVVEYIAEAKTKDSELCHGGSERILFVDDEEILVKLWCDILEDLGYAVTATTNSSEALELFRRQPDQFDLVITDMTMPGMTGIDLSRVMLELRPDIPVILCTGFNELVTEENAKAIGIREFAMKPLNRKRIATIIRKALNKKELDSPELKTETVD